MNDHAIYDYDPEANYVRKSTPRNGIVIIVIASPHIEAYDRLHIYANDVWMKTFVIEGADRKGLLRRANDYVDGVTAVYTEWAGIEATSEENKRRAYERAQDEAAELRANPPEYDPCDMEDCHEDETWDAPETPADYPDESERDSECRAEMNAAERLFGGDW